VIELLGIKPLLKRMPAKLSGGEKQRVAMARALAVSPDILLMDEPLSALDQTRKQAILPLLARLPQEFSIPIIYVTHASQEVQRLADYVVCLEAGQVVAEGSLAQIPTHLLG
jgi:molybdate transport system ATP-binding protein